jgi:hypothetical protein
MRGLLVVSLALLTSCRGDVRADLDLIDLYPGAEKRSTLEATQAFTVTDVQIDGTARRVILAHTPARVTWSVTIPRGATIRTWVALRPDAWGRDGDGVVFRIGVSRDNAYKVLARVHVDPRNRTEDRRWVPIEAALDNYAGERIKLIFSTDASEDPNRGDSRNDLALWGDPAVFAAQNR